MFWRLFARIAAHPSIADWLIKRAQRTPYVNLPGYMDRWWLFNAYDPKAYGKKRGRWLPSIRVHHILRADVARHLHDHPWNARTVILKGHYIEHRLEPLNIFIRHKGVAIREVPSAYKRSAGDTAAIKYNQYHSIDYVSDGGVWTLFITWRYRGPWGFKMDDGSKMPWQEYEEKYPT